MLKLLTTHPNAGKVVKDYFLNKMLETLDGDDSLPEDFKEHVRAAGIEDSKIDGIVGNNPRMLFDIFDEHSLLIEIPIKNSKFSYKIHSKNPEKLETIWFNTRRDAEQAAVEQAFQMLESMLGENNEVG